MRAAVERRRVQVPGPILGPERALELMLDVEQPDPDGSSKKRNWEVHQQEWPNADEPYHDGDQSRDRSVRRHGAEPGLAAPAHHADRQPVPQDEQISGTKAEHDNGVPIQAISKPTHRECARYSCTVSVRMSPIPRRSRLPELAWWMACVRRQKSYGVNVNTPMMRPTQSFASRWWKKAPCPQSCWIMKSRTRKPAAGTASSGQNQ